jgi:hypothetical protein
LFQLPTIQLVLVPEFPQKKLFWIVGTLGMPVPSVLMAEPLADVLASNAQPVMKGCALRV